MEPIPNDEFFLRIAAGGEPDISIVHKFGKNPAVGTSFVPVSVGGAYQTPQLASATALRVKAGGNIADTAAGAGAREITLVGLDSTGAEAADTLATAGASASAATTTVFSRLFRAYVSASGTYGTTAAGSHTGDIVIENAAGGTDWLTLDATDYSRGQSEVGCYTVPAGKRAFITNALIATDSSKSTAIILVKRDDLDDAAAPYEAMRIQFEAVGLTTGIQFSPKSPLGPYEEFTDLIWMAKVAVGTGAVEVDFEIVLFDV